MVSEVQTSHRGHLSPDLMSALFCCIFYAPSLYGLLQIIDKLALIDCFFFTTLLMLCLPRKSLIDLRNIISITNQFVELLHLINVFTSPCTASSLSFRRSLNSPLPFRRRFKDDQLSDQTR